MSDTQQKPRVRVQARSQVTLDSFQNFQANLGYGTRNITSGSTYGFNPITRNHILLEWTYRGSWLSRKVIDCRADDMTREGIAVESDMPPDQIDALNQYWMDRSIWKRLNATLKWGRLYGGCIAVIMIRGQDPATPLRIDTVTEGQFQGLLVLDRWMLWPHLDDPVTEPGARDWGLPRFYETTADARHVPHMKIHHSRVIRFEGVELPYWQRLSENMWGLSVLEPMWDRLIAYDSVTEGAAQLVYKAHLRVLKIPGLRALIAGGGMMYQGVLAQIAMIRLMQSNEGLTVLDGEDTFEANQYAFAGLSDMMVQFGQQVSGSADTPMTRMFSQSPAGMNATGDSDLRNYYDSCKSDQETELRPPVALLLDISHRSRFGRPLPSGFNYSFKPLWQLQESEKSQIAGTIAGATTQLLQDGVFTPKIAMKEIRQSSRITGFGSNITDEDIQSAEEQVPPEPPQLGIPGAGQGMAPRGEASHGEAMRGEAGPGEASSSGEEHDQFVLPMPELLRRPQQPPAAAVRAVPRRRQDAAAVLRRIASSGAPVRRSVNGKLNGKLNGASGHGRTHTTHVHVAPGLRSQINLPEVDGVVHIGDRAMLDVAGINAVVETQKGERRLGHGWSSVMPCHYGYISGTASAEGPHEQMDAFIGDNLNSDKVWIVEQREPGSGVFDEHKCLLGFDTRQQALDAYKQSFSDGSGEARIGQVLALSTPAFRQWLQDWPYGRAV